jgi:hypothetical protein
MEHISSARELRTGSTSYGIVCWQDNDPGNYEIYCTTFIPLADEGELRVEEVKVEDKKPFEVVGRTVMMYPVGLLEGVEGLV